MSGHLYEFKPKTCQWIGNNEECTKPVHPRQSYCTAHYTKIFKTATEEDIDHLVEEIEEKLVPTVISILEDSND